MAAKPPRKGPRLPQQEAFTLKNLDQVKVLADPLRIRILEALCEERTTKQVADLLGEKPSKLYHHVEALEKVGLIALTRTRQNRGTVEKYYLAVARTFRADARVFLPKGKRGGSKSAAFRQTVSTLLDQTAVELTSLVDRKDDSVGAIEEEAIVSFLEIHGSKAQLDSIRGKIHELIRSLTADDEDQAEPAGAAEQGRSRLMLAYYPLDPAKPGPQPKS